MLFCEGRSSMTVALKDFERTIPESTPANLATLRETAAAFYVCFPNTADRLALLIIPMPCWVG